MVSKFVPELEKKYRQAAAKDYDAAKSWLTQKVNFLRVGGAAHKGQGLSTRFDIGQMMFYVYDAKWKEELEFWDRFPLTIPIKKYDDGFLGLNFHYLPPRQRAVLLGTLMDFATNTAFDKTTKIKATYEALNGFSRYDLFRPTLHRYLYSHCRTKFLIVDPSEWHIALFLPVAHFVKGGSGKRAGQKYWERRVWGNTGKKR
jgi:hypothetical protein